MVEYYSYLESRIDYERFHLTATPELLGAFESVFLWLQDKLLAYPDGIRNQVLAIIRDKQLCETIGIVANLSDRHLQYLRLRPLFRVLIAVFSLVGLRTDLTSEEKRYLTAEKLFETKVSLGRLSQILLFATTIEAVDYDESFQEFRDHYDPNLVNKHKLVALINILRVQIQAVPNEDYKKLVLEKLEGLEAELKRSKVRWGVVISGFFVLLGFLADVKTVAPSVYERPIELVERILGVLHSDGVVRQSRPSLLALSDEAPYDKPDDDVPSHAAIPPEAPRSREEQEDDD